MAKLMRLGLPVVGVAALLAVWHFYVILFNVPTAVLPRPAAVLDSLVRNWRLIQAEGWVTLRASLYGFLLAFVLGVPIAVAISSSRVLNLMFYPLLIATQSVPKVALAPLILIWLGTGLESKLAIAWLVYRHLGLRFLKQGWFNLDAVWGASLVVTGGLSAALAW